MLGKPRDQVAAGQAGDDGGPSGGSERGLGTPVPPATMAAQAVPSVVASQPPLAVGGAYTVTLALDFAAEYRWQLGDAPMSAWAELPERHPSWSASHPVQEAQAVLTRR